MKNDTISRQDVIELVKNSYYNLAESMDDTWAMVADVEKLPSAQPEVAKDTNVPINDTISRQAAIDVLEKIPVRGFKKTDDGLLDALIPIGQVYRALKQLPSAQPEHTTDIWDKLREVYNMDDVPDAALSIIGDVMLMLE